MSFSQLVDWYPYLSTVTVAIAVFLGALSYREVWDRLAQAYISDLTPTIKRLNIDDKRIPALMRIWGILIVVALVIGFIAPPLVIASLFFVYIAPKAYLNYLIAQRRTLLRDQLVGASEALANTTRAGLSLAQGLEAVEKDAPRPLADEIKMILYDFNHGLPLPKAIERTKDRLQHDSFTLLAASLLTSLERGGKISEALDRISYSLKEMQRVERKMEADTAGGKSVLVILSIFPMLFLLLFLFIYPEGTMELFGSLIGQAVLLVIIILVYISVTWGQRILSIE